MLKVRVTAPGTNPLPTATVVPVTYRLLLAPGMK